jgi:SAM-dependent methyltransferase
MAERDGTRLRVVGSRGITSQMKPPEASSHHWNDVADGWHELKQRNPVLARHKRRVYADLIQGWTGGAAPRYALKTDLFAEAFNDEEFLSSLPWRERLVGIDISSSVLKQARRRPTIGTLHGHVTCDVARLPFKEGSFDLVVSDSTLDHLKTEGEIRQALGELARVLAPGGRLILTIDNPSSLTYPPRWLVKLWMRLGLAPYYIGVTLPLACLRADLEHLGLRVAHETAILHYPHPDGLVRLCERCARWLGRGTLDRLVAQFFTAAEQLGGTRLRYLTGRYLAVDAIKGNAP